MCEWCGWLIVAVVFIPVFVAAAGADEHYISLSKSVEAERQRVRERALKAGIEFEE